MPKPAPAAFEAFSAPMALVYANGTQLIGWATDLRSSESTHNVPVDVLGDVFTQQYVPTAVKCAMSVGKVYIMDYSIADQGLFHPGDENKNVIQFPELTFELYDQIVDKPRLRLIGCKGSRVEYSLSRGNIMAENASYDVRKIQRVGL